MFSAALLFSLVQIVNAAPTHTLCRGVAPENDRWIPANQIEATGISSQQFDAVLDRLEQLYIPEISAKGGKLQIERRWNDGVVNAYANRTGNLWRVVMFGGMARHPSLTKDGFAMVACHELGHHLGGAPKYVNEPDLWWGSYEGAADYYASLKCLRRYFAKDDNGKILSRMKLDPVAVSTCQREHASLVQQQLCIRSTMAGLSLAAVLADLESVALAKLSTPDARKVRVSNPDHPAPQCRLDTYFGGALCRSALSSDLDDTDYRPGSCTDTVRDSRGVRPRCWFAP